MSLMGTPMRSGAWAGRELSAAAAAHQLAKALGSARRDCRRCTRPARNHPALNPRSERRRGTIALPELLVCSQRL
jgi:hypothetical protein